VIPLAVDFPTELVTLNPMKQSPTLEQRALFMDASRIDSAVRAIFEARIGINDPQARQILTDAIYALGQRSEALVKEANR
jgi:hypothetical protein